jgi:hypothetical protein
MPPSVAGADHGPEPSAYRSVSPINISREEIMADDNSGGANTFIGFLLGAVLVAVGVVGFFMWDNYKSHTGGGAPAATITVKKG